MSPTKSPISSGPTNTGTHNSSMAQRSWRHSLDFQIIPAWRMGEIEFQCHLTRFVISIRFELMSDPGESKWRWKGTMMNSGGREVRIQEKRSAWCGVRGGQGECWWWWKSAEWDWGAQIQANERRRGLRSANPMQQPVHAEQRGKGKEGKHSGIKLRCS